MNWRRWILALLLPLLLLIGGWRFWYAYTGGFTVEGIHAYLPFDADRAVAPLPADRQVPLAAVVDQPYTYLGKGAQCFAFISQDGQYVMKFFKSKHYQPTLLARLASPLPFLTNYLQEKRKLKKQQLAAIFSGYLLAYQYLGADSGILYLHLNGGEEFQRNLLVRDGFGSRWAVALDPTIFVLQRYSEPLASVLDSALKNDNKALAHLRLKQVVDMYLRSYAQGIYDRDHAVTRNIGFAGEQPIHLDVGHLTFAPNLGLSFFKNDLLKVFRRINTWLKENYPQYRAELMAQLHRELEEAPFFMALQPHEEAS